MKLAKLLCISILFFTVCACTRSGGGFVTVRDGRFVDPDGQAVYFVGMNFWYGAILGSAGPGGDRERLERELDRLKSIGADNLRVLVGSDGLPGVPSKVEPTLQTAPGVYNDAILDGLDYLMAELGERDMRAVLYLTNAWEWSGGYSQYLSWAEGSPAPVPAVDGWPAYMEYVKGFLRSEPAKEMFAKYVNDVVSRTNRYTGKAYRDDPAIFSWQIANEPRAFSEDNKELLYEWIGSVARLIKSVDPNHLVSTGSEGSWGCEGDIELWGRILAIDAIDYGNIHIWPYNWGWLRDGDGSENPQKNVRRAIDSTLVYIDRHLEVSKSGAGKPVTLEEFGFPRDGLALAPGSPTTARDTYYIEVLKTVERSAAEGGLLAGCNIWGWGGEAVATQEFWRPGDPYTGDPAQEPQGLNSVFATDAAVEIVRTANDNIDAALAASHRSLSPSITYSVVETADWLAVSPAVPVVRIAAQAPAGKAPAGKAMRGTLRLVAAPDECRGFDAATGRFSYDLLPYVFDATRKVKLAAGGSEEVVFEVDLPAAGFYRCLVIADGRDTIRRFNVGLDPEKIVSEADAMPDFDEFWQRTRAELDAVAPEYVLTPLPDSSSVARTIYRVTMRSLGGETIAGFYAQPNKAGKHPAIVTYMGYGSQPWCFDPDANPDYAEFVLSTRGQGLNAPDNKYGDWITFGLDDKDDYYYRGAFMDLVRAVDFVASRPEVDTRRIFAEGGSQGGAFTMVAAALDHRIAAAAPTIPFLSDYRAYFSIVHWPAEPVLNKARELGISEDDLYRTLSYFDVKNLAGKIECPVLMGFGLQDEVCPPRTNFAGYNLIRSPKEYRCYPQSGHWTGEGWWADRTAFFERISKSNI